MIQLVPERTLLVGSKTCFYHIRGDSWTQLFTAQNEFKSVQSNTHYKPRWARFWVGQNHKWNVLPAVGISKPKGWHMYHTRALFFLYFTDVIGEVDLQRLDQEPFLHQLLVQRFNGPGGRAAMDSVSAHTQTSSLSVPRHRRREL